MDLPHEVSKSDLIQKRYHFILVSFIFRNHNRIDSRYICHLTLLRILLIKMNTTLPKTLFGTASIYIQ